MSKKLVIVESPAKAKTINQYLGNDYVVESSIGHIRDIPAKKTELPESKRKTWDDTRFGINVDDGYTPIYRVSEGSKKQVRLLKQKMKDVDELYLATDEETGDEVVIKRLGNAVVLLPTEDPWQVMFDALREFPEDIHLERAQPPVEDREVIE